MSSAKLAIIDGHGLIYRAFFAIRSLSTSAGIPTNAVYGFARMIEQYRRILQPTHWIVTFDGGLPVERMAILASYKAQRPSMPDELRGQIPLISRYLTLSGVPQVMMDGCEADDVIATLVSRFARDDMAIVVVSSDKDLLQLVGAGVTVIRPSAIDHVLDEAGVKAKMGVGPAVIPDLLALVGDQSDNIPGVRGVGPKTAAKLLVKYESVREVYAHIEEVEPVRIREALRESRAIVDRNVDLVRLRRDLDTRVELADIGVKPVDSEALDPFLEELELHTLVRDQRG
ncbi:MAG: 5'-3' exonuclease [Lentisphaerales bacterium]|nr:MAG: 5'-3' exonuclease [Lentisphaerales bacterium]